MSVSSVAKIVGSALAKNSPSILTGFGVVCFIGATIAAVISTPKAMKRIENAEQKKAHQEPEELDVEEAEEETSNVMEQVAKDYLSGLTAKQTAEKYGITVADVKTMVRMYKKQKRQPKPGKLSKWEVVKVTATLYIPAVLMILCGIICVIISNKVSIDRTMAAIAACELSGSALKEYQDKTVEKFGDKADKEIKEEVAKDKIKQNPPENNQVIITGQGDFLCYEPISKQYIKSTTNAVRGAVYNIRDALSEDGWCSVNDYLNWLHAEEMPYGDDIGWSATTPNETKVEFNPVYDRADPEDDTPCLVINVYPLPENKYKGGQHFV